MLDICLLGTGGMMPLPNRFLSSCMLRAYGKLILIDCGEGTQVTLKMAGLGFKAIEAICFTHFHGDHIAGLPGLLLTMANSGKTEPLYLIGPSGLEKVVTGLMVIVSELPFPVYLIEIPDEKGCFDDISPFHITWCPVVHRTTCLAYRFDIRRMGRFYPEKAQELGIPMRLWSQIQKDGSATDDGICYTQDMVMGGERKGISVTFCTDGRPSDRITKFAADSELFICEGMYGDDEMLEKAQEHKHMLYSEAATMAKNAGVTQLILTHFSPSMFDTQEFLPVAQAIFPNTEAGYDRMKLTLHFPRE